jgi:hypothetical protein
MNHHAWLVLLQILFAVFSFYNPSHLDTKFDKKKLIRKAIPDQNLFSINILNFMARRMGYINAIYLWDQV